MGQLLFVVNVNSLYAWTLQPSLLNLPKVIFHNWHNIYHFYFSLMYPPLSPVSPPNNNNSHESIQNILASHNSAAAAMPFAIGGGLPSLTPKPQHGSSSQQQQLLRSGSPGIAARKGSIERAMKIELSKFCFQYFKILFPCSLSTVNFVYGLIEKSPRDLLCLA